MLKNKLAKIAQTAVKRSFDVGFLDVIVFIDLGYWFFLIGSFEILLTF